MVLITNRRIASTRDTRQSTSGKCGRAPVGSFQTQILTLGRQVIVQLTKLNCSLQDMESRYVVLAELFSTCLASSHVWKTNSRESHLPLNCVNDQPCSELCEGIWAYPVGGVGNQGTTFKELRVSRVDACMLSPTLGL